MNLNANPVPLKSNEINSYNSDEFLLFFDLSLYNRRKTNNIKESKQKRLVMRIKYALTKSKMHFKYDFM